VGFLAGEATQGELQGELNHGTRASSSEQYRERKCADTIDTVLVLWAGHFQIQIQYVEAVLSKSTRKLLLFEISKMLIVV